MDETTFPTFALLILGLSWTAYFALHSWLASLGLKRTIETHWPALMPRYRLLYNLLAVVLLVPPVIMLLTTHSPIVWQWEGGWRWLSHALLLFSLAGFWFTTRYYDMPSFMGLRQSTTTHFSLSPVHRYVRHPWYCLGLVLLWSRDMDAARLLVVLLASVYLWYGSRLEDRKLVAEFGAVYRSYLDRVPGLFPLPGRTISRHEANQLLVGKPLA